MLTKKNFLNEIILISPVVFNDDRGFFYENYHELKYKELGITCTFVQDNISRSKKGTLRGMHYQLNNPQAKLITVLRGAIFDVAIDIRIGSPTFGQWYGTELNDENHNQLFIPEGFAHGFYVLSDFADIHYKCSDFYNNKDEYGIQWNDSKIQINWPLLNEPILSFKDAENISLTDIDNTKLPKYSVIK
ncbi:dTDP-4-dehydrorhamnose 3,5-epimerase [Silvanigrella paludirubra]|uniref:dTDP-4-dehydrorhamnose 3,5-epimerase n=1 Tax=Silvanigrella paludirubra TaxID=2499159 RepID=A0A6N6VPD1_9BACT|nr:dTDP-4-dehydrorhamnose 3,5-epimerase [Silvanigrella paludirubra]KAB8036806.1 dTDP-4-dehydrorhamnose 3,5-epimerase [Silvanigrella paludirubra]